MKTFVRTTRAGQQSVEIHAAGKTGGVEPDLVKPCISSFIQEERNLPAEDVVQRNSHRRTA